MTVVSVSGKHDFLRNWKGPAASRRFARRGCRRRHALHRRWNSAGWIALTAISPRGFAGLLPGELWAGIFWRNRVFRFRQDFLASVAVKNDSDILMETIQTVQILNIAVICQLAAVDDNDPFAYLFDKFFSNSKTHVLFRIFGKYTNWISQNQIYCILTEISLLNDPLQRLPFECWK